MNILVIGGSNSLLKGGYVHHLQETLAARGDVTIHQLSVGATSSLAAIGRLFDTAGLASVDVILYEYAINDAGHFAWRPDGVRSWLLCLHLLLQAAAQLYPDAVFVPLVFSMQRAASPAVQNPFYDAQIAAFAALELPTIDIRRWLADLFLGRPPAWLYRDDAHYSPTQAASLIACEIARRLPALVAAAEPVSATWTRMQALSPHGALQLFYVKAASLAQFCSGPAQLSEDSNRLMQLTYLRMAPGSSLSMRTAMFPLAFYVKSDADHGSVRLTMESADVNGAVTTGTRHADTATLRFICANLPVPLLFGQALAVSFGPASFALTVPSHDEPGGAAVTGFDCFTAGPSVPEQHFDLCGVLFVARASLSIP
jgi:hypothetical protein